MSHALSVNINVALIDLAAQRTQLGDRIDNAIERVLAHGQFILGPEVSELEAQLSALTGVRHAVSCGSGTDALLLALMAHGIGRGDAIEAALRCCAIATAVHYRTPLHRQPAYRDALVGPRGVPVTERLADEVLSLPMHPYLDETTQGQIVDCIRAAAG